MKKLSIVLLLDAVFVLLVTSCGETPTTVAGGSDDHGNAFIAGKVVHENGNPASRTRVLLLREDYIPGLSALSAADADTADAAGIFGFPDVPNGSYNLQMSNDSAGTNALAWDVQAAGQDLDLAADTLRAPGVLCISTSIVADSQVSVFVPGTTLRSAVTPADMAQGYFFIDSVPAALFPQIRTLSLSGTVVEVPLAEPCRVAPGDTATVRLGPVYRVSRTGASVTVDGNLAEFAGVPPVLLSDTLGGRGEYRMLYDDSALYVGALVYDRRLNAATAADDAAMSPDDCIELLFDTRRDRSTRPQTDDFKLFVNLRNAHVDSRGNGLMFDVAWTSACTSAVVISGTLDDNADIDSLYRVEIAIPWSSLGIIPISAFADTLGFDLVLNNRNTAPLTERCWTVWANTNGYEILDDTATGCSPLPGLECSPFNDPAGYGELIFAE